MTATITPPPAVSRLVTVATMAVIVLSGAGLYFAIKAPSNNNVIVQQWQTKDGRQKGYMTGSGALSLSGSIVTRGTLSGASTLTLSPLGNSPTNKVLCSKANGVIGTMTVTATGTVLKTCN